MALFSFAATLTYSPHAAFAQNQEMSFIRDAEIENNIRIFGTPLLKAAGLDPEALNIILVNDNGLNAFVAGGQNLFINTGLIVQAETPGQLIGVIAHEIGHIAGGHLGRTRRALKEAKRLKLIGVVLGALVAIGSGRPDAGYAAILGSQAASLRTLLRFSRTQESAADQAGLRLMDQLKWPSDGLLKFLETLQERELLGPLQQAPYLRTHPLSRDRVESVRSHVARSAATGASFPQAFYKMHQRMRAKLSAFIQSPLYTFRRYKEKDRSIEARYAKAIAYYRKADLDRALPLIDGLLAEHPQDPYFWELKGQMLFENGRLKEALPAYASAVKHLPSSALLHQGLARVQLELQDPALLEPAVINLKAAAATEPNSAFTWRLLATAYGRQGDEVSSALSLAEEALLQNENETAWRQARKAQALASRGSRQWLQAEDILAIVKPAALPTERR